MSQVHLIAADEAPLPVRAYFAQGDPGPLASSLAHVPALMASTLPFVSRVLGASSIDVRTKQVVILRTSALQQCRYCINTYTVVAMRADLDRAEIDALRGPGDASLAFDAPCERALLRWTDAVALGRGPLDAEVTAEFKAHFEDAEVVELTLLVGATVMLNRYATALDLPTTPPHLERLRSEGFAP